MAKAVFHFPTNFKWGTATSSHQVEGNNTNNDWWVWEQEEGRILQGHRSGLACNGWAQMEADLDRAAALGQNSHRMSVEWSRIEPQEGRFDDNALERYREILRAMRQRGIEPMVTLHHFTNPLWLAEMAGWENGRVVPLFERYVARVVQALGEFCHMWCTINEPNVLMVSSYVLGTYPPGKQDLRAAIGAGRNMMKAHGVAYRRIHDLQPHAQVGFAHNLRLFDPANPRSLLDRQVAAWHDRGFNKAFLTAAHRGWWRLPLGFGPAWQLRKTLDWIGLNYYTRDMVTFDRQADQELFGRRFPKEGAELLDGGYGEFYPEGMARSIQRLARLGLPIYITENGLPDADDDQRPRYLLTHLHQVWKAIQLCYPVMGYYHWTLVDNFEWAEGWTMRFGLIELDLETQERRLRRSAYLYQAICQMNRITPQIIDQYAPELRATLLPG